MPYLEESERDKELKKQQGQQGGEAPILSSGAGAVMQGQGAQNASQPEASPFANIQKYLKQNRPGAQQMSEKVGGNIEGTIQGAETQGQTVQSNINADLAAAPTYNENAINQVRQNPIQADVGAFQSQLNAQYGGPQSAQQATGYDDLIAKLNSAKQKTDLAQSESGRSQLLSETYKRPQYTSGQKALDQSLVQTDPLGQEKIKSSQDKYNQLAKNQAAAVETQNAAIAAKQAEAEKARTEATKAFQEKQGALTGGIQERLATTNAQRKKEIEEAIKRYQSAGIYGVNAAQYLTPNYAEITTSQVANSDEIANLEALQNLASTNPDLLTSDALSVIANKGQAGNIAPAYTFNEASYNQAVATNQAARDNELGAIFDDMAVNALGVGDQSTIEAQKNKYLDMINSTNAKYGIPPIDMNTLVNIWKEAKKRRRKTYVS